jgi:outer membrane biosynthesis protein TonB
MRCSSLTSSMLLAARILFLLSATKAQTPPPLLAPSAPYVTRPIWSSAPPFLPRPAPEWTRLNWRSARFSSAEKEKTPATHAFKKDFADQIGRAWYRDVEASSHKIAIGTARIALTASPDGKITNVRVLSNTSNKLFAKICLSAIQRVKIPPVPQELLSHGKFEDEITFTVFPK